MNRRCAHHRRHVNVSRWRLRSRRSDTDCAASSAENKEMILIDTSAWIDLLGKRPKLTLSVERLLDVAT